MVGLRCWLYWMAAITIYWVSALWLLYRVFRIFVDGGGAIASFYWGSHLLVANLADFQQSSGTRLSFQYPYWVAASIITFVGCGLSTWLVHIWRPKHSRRFLVSSVTTLLSLLLVGAISDAGTALHVWRGPVMYNSFANLLVFLEVLVPMSLFAGILELVRTRLNA